VILFAYNYDSNILDRVIPGVHSRLDLPSFLRQHSPVSESHRLSGTRKMALIVFTPLKQDQPDLNFALVTERENE